jgi:sugar phosphate isomerase/epimerase
VKIGAFLGCFEGWALDDALGFLRACDAEVVELSTFGRRVALEYSLDELLDSPALRDELRGRIANFGLSISSLSCHGNALHPQHEIAALQSSLFRSTVSLAASLNVSTVVDFSGCPGDGPNATYPNWVTCAWPDDFPIILDWQWNEAILPYWRETASFCEDSGVQVAIEMHPGMAVYNPRTLMRLRDEVSPVIGANLDPSHLIWQQIDVPGAIRYLSDAIYHVHLKDCALRGHKLSEVGVLDTTPFRDWSERGWLYRTVGHGQDQVFWKRFLETLKEVGYAGPLSVEHEDVLFDVFDGTAKAIRFARELRPATNQINEWWSHDAPA